MDRTEFKLKRTPLEDIGKRYQSQTHESQSGACISTTCFEDAQGTNGKNVRTAIQ